MAGNRRAYDTAMKRAGNQALERRWSRAIEEYGKALAEFPQDVAALTGLGLAYVETRQLEKALDMYKQAANLSPDNPEVIQRVGQIFERLAKWPDAARAYVLTADAHLRLRDISHATALWRKATILDPGNLTAHRNLAKAYQSQGDNRRAARHHLIMARVTMRDSNVREAIEHCNVAIRLDPRNAEAQAIMGALQRSEPLPDGPTARLQPDAKGKRTLDSFVVFEDIEVTSAAFSGDEERASPADLVRENSLTQIAEALFSEDTGPDMMEANLLLGQAADFQTRGLTDKAIEAYSGALALGVDTLAVHFNLGLLHLGKNDFQRAFDHLNRTLPDPEYALGAHFAMAEGYYTWGKTAEALSHLLQVLMNIDLETVAEHHVGGVEPAYEQLHQQCAVVGGPQTAQRCTESIMSFLRRKGWGPRLIETRKELDRLVGGALLVTLGEVLSEPEAETTILAMGRTRDYLKRDLLFTALEESLWAIQRAPYYLPLHLRVSEILIQAGRSDEAVQKLIVVAETYKVRGDLKRAIAVYRNTLELAPMNTEVRERLIRILLDARMVDQAIEQYIAAADAYYQLAQVDRAVDMYSQALEYASMGDPTRHWEANMLHRIGDIHMQRIDWRQAIKAYRRIVRIEAEDEKAHSYLVDLYFKTGQRDQAMSELDELIELHKAKRKPQQLIAMLQDIIRSQPKELALHMRLAKTYLDLRMKNEAIAELDTVGNMQLEAGKTREAIRTIQAIIRLGPERVEGYRQLLAQLAKQ